MDLGIKGKKALVLASSQGLGLACARSLAREGANIVLNGRDEAKLQTVSEGLKADFPGISVEYVAADLTSEAGRDALIKACPEADILVTNNAGPPPGALENWDEAALLGAMGANFIPAALLIRAYIPGMRERRFGRIVNITSAMVKTPHYMMGLSTSARTALTALSKAISGEVACDNVTINNLLPERIDTPRQEFMARRRMEKEGLDWDEARRRNLIDIKAGRYGLPEEFGDACAFLCSAQAGYISGQNMQLDGGSYEGLV